MAYYRKRRYRWRRRSRRVRVFSRRAGIRM